MLPLKSLAANRWHGILVAFIPPIKLFRGLQANPLFDILKGDSEESFKYNWIHSAASIARKMGFRTLHHLLLSNTSVSQLNHNVKAKYQPEVKQSIHALQEIGIVPNNPITNFDEGMSQLFFHNPDITSGIHNRPFMRSDYPLLSKHLYYIGQLFKGTMFNTMRPQPNPRAPFRSRRQLEHKHSCTLTPIQYGDSIASIPQTLIDLILPGNVPLITGNVYRHGHIYQNTYYFVICGNS